MIRFSIIIPNHNGQNFIPDLLASLFACNYPDLEIILVDNASTDNSLITFNQSCNQYHFRYTVINLDKNYGFGYACNQGVNIAQNSYVIICNNDLTLHPRCLHLISQAIIRHSSATCFCPTVLNRDDTFIESQGISFDYSGKCLQNNHGQPLLETKNYKLKIINYKLKIKKVWGSSAAFVIYNKSVFLKLGGFRSVYFAYLEDVDLSYRLHQKKYQTLLIPSAICYHLGGGTADKNPHFRAFYTFRNWFIFLSKNYSLFQIFKYFPSLTLERLRNLSYLLRSFLI